MDQIRANQVLPSRELAVNPYVAPPRDLVLNTKELDASLVSNIPQPSATGSVAVADQSSGGVNYGNALNDTVQAPATPMIIGIKEQIINMHDDGTVTIDVILNVQDVPGVTEYDIRVGKDAGNL